MRLEPGKASGERGLPAVRAGGAIAVLLAAAAWGSTGTAAHFAPGGASPVSVGAARILIGGSLLFGLAISDRRQRAELRGLVCARGPARAALIAAAVSVGGYQLAFFSAVRLTGVAVGTTVAIGSAPVLTGLISRLTGGARLTWRWMAATAGAVAGCAVLVSGGSAAGINLLGVGLALTAGLCYAIYAVTAARLISAGTGERAVMGVLFGAGAVLLAPVLAASSPGWLLTGRGAAVAAYLGVITTAVAYLLYGRGLRSVPAPVAVTLGLAEPVVAALLAVVVLGERLTPEATAGVALVALALAVLVVPAPGARRDTQERVRPGAP